MKVGDVSRRRRLNDPARLRWYAHHRALRFSRRLFGAGKDWECPSIDRPSARLPIRHSA
jgi:hypothetical protein